MKDQKPKTNTPSGQASGATPCSIRYVGCSGEVSEKRLALGRILPDGREQFRVFRGLRVPWIKFHRWGVDLTLKEVVVWRAWETRKHGKIHRILR